MATQGRALQILSENTTELSFKIPPHGRNDSIVRQEEVGND
jgi:hypothetical protein